MLCSLPWQPLPRPPSIPSPFLLYLTAAFSFISLSLSTAMQLRGNILKISGSTVEYAARRKVESREGRGRGLGLAGNMLMPESIDSSRQ